MNWQAHAQQLAERVTHLISRWRPIIAAVPRHAFIPRWWNWTSPVSGYCTDTFTLVEGPADQAAWLNVAYRDLSLVTQVGPLHADHANPSARPSGTPTSSATLPSLIIQMLRHAMIDDGIDVDSYLTKAATERLDGIGLRSHVVTCDATGPLPGTYDRIVATVSVRPIPASWLQALRPGGRPVTTIAGTALILTADKTEAGGAGGPRRLWDLLDNIRTSWLRDGSPPVYGAQATVTPGGTVHLRRGRWQATIA